MPHAVRHLFDAIKRNAPMVEPLILKAPTTEWSVVFLLGQLSAHGGFQLASGTGGFPDCTLRVEVGAQAEYLKAELECYSSEYIRHGHPFAGCDAVICWVEDAQLGIPTLALSSLFPNVEPAAIPTIQFGKKKPELDAVFEHFHTWLVSLRFPAVSGGGK